MNIQKNLSFFVCLSLLTLCACRSPVQERKLIVEPKANSQATVSAWQRRGNEWKEVFRTEEAFVGIKGVTADKIEGDGKTPIGEFGIYRSFGIKDRPKTYLSYTEIQVDDVWVDDPKSKYYNQYVSVASNEIERDWQSGEELLPLSNKYRYVIVLEYNTTPIVPGKGSAIFIKCSNGKATSGDIDVPEKYMKKLFKFLRPGDKIEIRPVA